MKKLAKSFGINYNPLELVLLMSPQKKFKSLGLKWRHYHYDNNHKSIILRDKDKIDQNIPRNSTTERYRTNLNKINRFLLKHCVALDLDDKALQIIKKK